MSSRRNRKKDRWRAGQPSVTERTVLVYDRDGRVVCQVVEEIDAMLIAAAPKLAKLLDDMLYLCQYYDVNRITDDGIETIQKSRKLLNKLGKGN